MKRLKRMLSMLLVCCMVFTCLPITARALTIDDTTETVTARQYFPVTSESGNANWEFCGLVVDENKEVHLVLANANSNNKIDAETTLYIVYGDNSKSFCYGKDYGKAPNRGELVYQMMKSGSFHLNLTDDTGNTIGNETIAQNVAGKPAKSYYFFRLGGMEVLQESFKIGLETKTGGEDAGNAWDIGTPPSAGTDVTVYYDYDITKTVANDEDGDTIFENCSDETITYTVTIENKSSQEDGGTGILLPVHVEYVYDYVPDGLIVELKDNPGFTFAKDADGNDITNQLVLDTHVTLTPDGDTRSKTYTVVAKIDPNFTGGMVTNRAGMSGPDLVSKEDSVDVTIKSYFYVHHIKNDGQVGHEKGVEERVDKIEFNDTLKKDGKFNFDVTADKGDSKVQTGDNIGTDNFDSGKTTYKGLLPETLYGGTFEMSEGYTDSYDFADGESGINFTPKVNEHYYVWEPSNSYLWTRTMSVWNPAGILYDVGDVKVKAIYPLPAVDRENYRGFGCMINGKEEDMAAYDVVKTNRNLTDGTISMNTTNHTVKTVYGNAPITDRNPIFTGSLMCEALDESIWQANGDWQKKGPSFTLQAYWITEDGVKVTGENIRTCEYKGVGQKSAKFDRVTIIEDKVVKSTCTSVDTSSSEIAKIMAVFSDPGIMKADIPVIIYEGVATDGSGKTRILNLKSYLGDFKYDDCWFEVNGKRVDAEDQSGVISASFSLKGVKQGELTIIPCWSSMNGKTQYGVPLILNVTKRGVEEK